MSKTNITVLTLALLLGATAQAAEAPAYQPFPKGYGYLEPAEIRALNEAVQQGDNSVTRQHGWRLWAGIMQPASGLDWPVWYTWPNTTGAFAAKDGPPPDASCNTGASAPVPMGRRGRSTLPVNIAKTPIYSIPVPVIKTYGSVASCAGINDGAHFQFNGDIMIATESLTKEAFEFIRDAKQPLYLKKTLDDLHSQKSAGVQAPASYVVTKHMYWPVKAHGLTALPVWRQDYGPDYPGYAGYETWNTLIAIDPDGRQVGQTASVSYLHRVLRWDQTQWPTITKKAKVYGLKDFYHHRVTQADWDSFDDADKAIINAASYWLNNEPFGVGDYLVTVAMHINTKEIPSWGLQSVWWSDQPDSRPYAADRPAKLPAKGPWGHYLLTEAYGVPEKHNKEMLPVATNPYIELVTHPVGTNCYNCHARAGWPASFQAMVKDKVSYQMPECPGLRAALNPKSSCLQPFTLTDFQWIIPDRAK